MIFIILIVYFVQRDCKRKIKWASIEIVALYVYNSALESFFWSSMY